MTLAKRPAMSFLVASLLAGVFGLAAWMSSSASAQGEAPPQPDCAGLAFSDPTGDHGVPASTPVIPVTDNLDLTGGFLRYDADPDARTPLTANIRVANLSKEIPTGATGVGWTFSWLVRDVQYYVLAQVEGGETTYTYGIDEGSSLDQLGTTTGTFFEGPNGVIQIRVPQAPLKATDGSRLTETNAISSITYPGFLVFADNGPDSGAGKAYNVSQCPGAGGAGPSTPTTPTAFPITLTTSSVKSAKKGKSTSFKLRSSEQVSNVAGTLKKGSASYGAGKLASLSGGGTLKVKLKKALKKGSYTLKLTATRADGQKGSGTFKVKVR